MQNDNVKFKIKIFFTFFSFLFILHYSLLIINSVSAVCPLCTVALAGGLEITRILGVDDTIAGLWIGGLIVSFSLWLADWLSKKKLFQNGWREFVSLVLFYLLTLPFLFWSKMIGIPGNKFLGVDKIIFGLILGSLVFGFGVIFERYLKKINGGKVIIYYQKVLIPLFLLTIASLVLFLVT